MAEDKAWRKARPRDFIASDLTLAEAEALADEFSRWIVGEFIKDNPQKDPKSIKETLEIPEAYIKRWLKEIYVRGWFIASETGPVNGT